MADYASAQTTKDTSLQPKDDHPILLSLIVLIAELEGGSCSEESGQLR